MPRSESVTAADKLHHAGRQPSAAAVMKREARDLIEVNLTLRDYE